MASGLSTPHASQNATDLCYLCQIIDFQAMLGEGLSVDSSRPPADIAFYLPTGWTFDDTSCYICTLCDEVVAGSHYTVDSIRANLYVQSSQLSVISGISDTAAVQIYLQIRSNDQEQCSDYELAEMSAQHHSGLTKSTPLVAAECDFGWLRDRLELQSPEVNASDRVQSRDFDLYLLDCAALKVVAAGLHVKYAALSYTVGKDGALDHRREWKAPEELPRSISDAIYLTRKMELQYLWVDALCITAEGEAQRRAQLNSMAFIYADAWVVLVSLGLDRNSPLPGVTKGRSRHFSTSVRGTSITLGPTNIANLLRRSVHSTRCWTKQEILFPPRVVYLTEAGMMVADSTGYGWENSIRYSWHWSDSTTFEPDLTGLATYFRAASNSWGITMTEFTEYFEDYCSRLLTLESDALDAFRGVLAALHRCTFCIKSWGNREGRSLEIQKRCQVLHGQQARSTRLASALEAPSLFRPSLSASGPPKE